MIKGDIETITKHDLYYIVDKWHKTRFKPWLGDFFSFLYDFIMKIFIFPKKFGGDINQHYEILSQELKNIHGKRVLELLTDLTVLRDAISHMSKTNANRGCPIC
jgi:hypothetical protein